MSGYGYGDDCHAATEAREAASEAHRAIGDLRSELLGEIDAIRNAHREDMSQVLSRLAYLEEAQGA